METNNTDKNVLIKGLKLMLLALICILLGPTLYHIALSNQEKPLYIPILIVAIILCILAIYLAFKGINTILDSIFKSKKT